MMFFVVSLVSFVSIGIYIGYQDAKLHARWVESFMKVKKSREEMKDALDSIKKLK